MSQFEQFDIIKAKLPLYVDEVKQYIAGLVKVAEAKYHHLYLQALPIINGAKQNGVIQEFYNRYPASSTNFALASAVGIVLVFGGILVLTSVIALFTGTVPQTKPKKKLTKAQKANKGIQSILDHVETTFVPEIDSYIDHYEELKEKDVEFKYDYLTESLLKEILKLDEIDVGENEVLRTNRKKVIKFIQDHQKRLDKFKKEVIADSK